ncbi:CAP-Gly domain-containing linker protein 1-like [Dysidea avara]|uniref:CAP-Gly domain-containing linker protein 1-like n=1 Tax=Dysidea avara TaxID=196820 RepID=UPI0033343D58
MDCNEVQSANDVLRRLHVSFRRYLNFQSISPHLRSHNLLTDHEWQVISDKGSCEDQVDQLLKYLPQKGENCLHALIECLQSSLDHAGHKDLLVELKKQPELRVSAKEDFAKAVNTINDIQVDQMGTIEKLEAKLEDKNEEIKKKNEEINLLRKELDELKINHGGHIKNLEDQLSARDAKIQSLSEQLALQDTISYSSSEDECFDILTNADIPPGKTNEEVQSSSLNASCNEDYSDAPPPPRKRSSSDITELKHSQGAQNNSIENKLKAYQKDVTTYHKKRRNLKSEKEALVKTREELENELSHLKDELDAVSFSHFGSVHHNLSYSSLELAETKQPLGGSSEDFSELKRSISTQSRLGSITSYFTPKRSSEKKASRSTSLGYEEAEVSMPSKKSVSSSDSAHDPVYQGWLLKEGGQKKYWRKRWCVLSSHFFFYFEGKADPAMRKRPIGILPITPEMEVSEYVQENLFEIADKTRGYMKSCKLDKSRGGYVQGHHAVYKFQVSANTEKVNWVESFNKVLKNLKQQNV